MKQIREKRIPEKMFLKALGPAFFVMITVWGAIFIDGVIVCKFLGTDEIAAVGLAYPVISCVQLFAGCISTGVQVYSSRKIGCGETEDVRDLFAEMITLCVIISVVLMTVVLCFAGKLAGFLGASQDAGVLRKATADYIRGYAVGIPAVILNVLFRIGLQLSDSSANLKLASLAYMLADVVLDLVAVACGSGTFGVGLASAASYYVSFLFFIGAIRKGDTMLSLSLRKIRKESVVTVVTLGSENLVRRSINMVRPLIINRLIVFFGGVTALSALSIQNNITSIAYIPGNAIVMALGIVTGLFYGENNEKELCEVNAYCKRFIWAVSAGLAALLFLFSGSIARFYVPEDGALRKLVILAAHCAAVQLPFNTLIYARLSYLQATLQTKKALVCSVFYNLVLVLLCVSVFSRIGGSAGVFIGFLVADVLMPLISRAYYMGKYRKFRLTAREASGLPDDFFLAPEDHLLMEVRDNRGCTAASEKAFTFCEAHSLPARTATKVALCIEEWCKNIIEHGYKTDPAQSEPITVFLKTSGDGLTVTIKDVAQKFDIVRYIEAMNQEQQNDPARNIGIRLIRSSAKDIRYTRVMDTNIIIFTV